MSTSLYLSHKPCVFIVHVVFVVLKTTPNGVYCKKGLYTLLSRYIDPWNNREVIASKHKRNKTTSEWMWFCCFITVQVGLCFTFKDLL